VLYFKLLPLTLLVLFAAAAAAAETQQLNSDNCLHRAILAHVYSVLLLFDLGFLHEFFPCTHKFYPGLAQVGPGVLTSLSLVEW